MPPIRRKPSLPPAVICRQPTAIVHRPIPPALLRRQPTAIVRQPIPPPTMGSMVKSGFSWGLGNGVANALVGSVLNNASTVPPSVSPSVLSPSIEYVQCMKDFDDKEACKHLLK